MILINFKVLAGISNLTRLNFQIETYITLTEQLPHILQTEHNQHISLRTIRTITFVISTSIFAVTEVGTSQGESVGGSSSYTGGSKQQSVRGLTYCIRFI